MDKKNRAIFRTQHTFLPGPNFIPLAIPDIVTREGGREGEEMKHKSREEEEMKSQRRRDETKSQRR